MKCKFLTGITRWLWDCQKYSVLPAFPLQLLNQQEGMFGVLWSNKKQLTILTADYYSNDKFNHQRNVLAL